MGSGMGSPASLGAGAIGRPRYAVVWLVAFALLAVSVVRQPIGGTVRAVPAHQTDPAAQATATRDAELAEIAALQAEVAALQTQAAEQCAEPTPTVEPTPVPPSPVGQPVALADGWTVTVLGASSRPTVEEVTAQGTFVEVVVTISNNEGATRAFPFLDLNLVDAQGRAYALDTRATTWRDGTWGVLIGPSMPEQRYLIFDVLPDAGDAFILESQIDPTFRAAVSLTPRG